MFFKSITRWRFFWWNIVWVKLTSYMLLGSTRLTVGLPCSSDGKESTCNARDPGSIPGSGRSSGEGIDYPLQYSWASLVAQLVKNPTAMWETWVEKIPWKRAWQLIPVFLPGESPWTEEPGKLQSLGLQRVRHDWETKHSTAQAHSHIFEPGGQGFWMNSVSDDSINILEHSDGNDIQERLPIRLLRWHL